MRVIRAKTAGFCMGVGLALQKLDDAITRVPQAGRRLLMLGPIIHNPQVLASYANRGVLRVDGIDEVCPGDTVVIRAHGIPRGDEIRLARLGATIVDATCPKVKRAQLAIAEATADGSPLHLFGEAEHPEVRGLISYAGGTCLVFGKGEISSLSPCTEKAVLAAQTTQDRSEFEALCTWFARDGNVRVLSTICDATRKRQEEAEKIARRVDVMVVVGGRESGNTRRLAEVVRSRGLPVLHVETPDELQELSLRKYAIAGITAGASTPKHLIDAVHELLENTTGK